MQIIAWKMIEEIERYKVFGRTEKGFWYRHGNIKGRFAK